MPPSRRRGACPRWPVAALLPTLGACSREAASALALQRLSTQPWVHFTPQSNDPPTRAKPAVWREPVR